MEWTSCLRLQIACMCIDEIEWIEEIERIDEIEWIDEIECIDEIGWIVEIGWIALPFSYVLYNYALYNNVYLLMIC